MPISIDPTNPGLSLKKRQLLAQFLLEEEKKHGQKRIFKRKEWEKGKTYTLLSGKSIVLPSHEISRRPKRYAAVVILGPNKPMPTPEERKQRKKESGINALYLKKHDDGRVETCTSLQDPSKFLTSAQIDELEALNFINFNNDKAQIIKNLSGKTAARKKISHIQAICGYQKYLYTVTHVPTDKPEGEGSYGAVNSAPGKLELELIDGKPTARFTQSEKELITKKVMLSGKEAEDKSILNLTPKELAILLEIPALKRRLGTKQATIQKDAHGNILSFRFTQRKVPGVELEEILEKIPPLSDEQRLELAPWLVRVLAEDHAAGIVHRDIKPGNIMVDIDLITGKIKAVNIIDYGFAAQKSVEDIKLQSISGTPTYLSPEMCAQKLGGQQGDDYAMGLILRNLLKDRIFSHPRTIPQAIRDGAERYYGTLKSLSYPDSPLFQNLKDQGHGEEAKTYEQILYGMTQAFRADRMSSAAALKLLKPDMQIELEENSYLYEQDEEDISERGEKILEREKVKISYLDKFIAACKAAWIFYRDYLKVAWNETYRRNMSPDDRENSTFSDYFLGWPGGKGGGAWFSYFALGGFILTPLKNVLKLAEFAIKGIAESFHCLVDLVRKTQPTSGSGEFAQLIAYACLSILYGATAFAGWLVSTVTSPMANAKAAFNKDEDLGIRATGVLSLIVTVAAYAAITIAAAPLILLAAAKLGIVAGFNVATGVGSVGEVAALSVIAAPSTWFLGATAGLGMTTLLAGGAFVAIATAGALAIRAGLAAFLEWKFDGKKPALEAEEPDRSRNSSSATNRRSFTSSTSHASSSLGLKLKSSESALTEEKHNSLAGSNASVVADHASHLAVQPQAAPKQPEPENPHDALLRLQR